MVEANKTKEGDSGESSGIFGLRCVILDLPYPDLCSLSSRFLSLLQYDIATMAASLSSCRCPWQTIRSSLIPNRTQRAAVALISTAMVAKPPLRRSLATSTAFSHSTNASLSQGIRWQPARRPLEPVISARHLTASSRRGYKTVQEAKARHRSGVRHATPIKNPSLHAHSILIPYI